MHTSLVLFALSGVFGPGAVVDQGPKWLNDYNLARQRCLNENKPLAIFIGTGKQGWSHISKEHDLGTEAPKILAEMYVCLYIDRKETEGWKLAGAFEMTGGPGLIISNPQAQLQAFRHEGDLDTADLTRFLKRYSDPERVVAHTEVFTQNRVSNYYDPNQGGAAPSQSSSGGGRSC